MKATANTRTTWRRSVASSTAARIRAAQIKTRETLYRRRTIPRSDGSPGPVRGARPEKPVRPAPPPGPGPREAARAANPGRDPEGDGESRRAAGRTPCRGAGEPLLSVHGDHRWTRGPPDGKPGTWAGPRGL